MTSQGPRETRLESLDVLRGVAVLGIFAMNVQAFAQIPSAYDNPTVGAVFGEVDSLAWRLGMVIFAEKFMVLFTGLFGASLLVMLGDTRDASADERHHRRMAWLAVIGACHALVIWYGDVLFLYAVAGVLVHSARTWSPRRLLIVGAGLILLTAAFMAAVQLYRFDEGADYQDALAYWSPPPEEAEHLRALYGSPWHARFVESADHTLLMQFSLVTAYLPRTAGVMMLGMALWKVGFLHARLPGVVYALVALLIAPSAWIADLGARGMLASNFEFLASAAWRLLINLGSVPQALGYAALVMLVVKTPMLEVVRGPFAAAGRMALSNYLGCSMVGFLIFFGPPGAGLIGSMGRAEQFQVVLLVWAAMLIISPLWLRFYRFGPMEWVLRSLAYARAQPLRRRSQ